MEAAILETAMAGAVLVQDAAFFKCVAVELSCFPGFVGFGFGIVNRMVGIVWTEKKTEFICTGSEIGTGGAAIEIAQNQKCAIDSGFVYRIEKSLRRSVAPALGRMEKNFEEVREFLAVLFDLGRIRAGQGRIDRTGDSFG